MLLEKMLSVRQGYVCLPQEHEPGKQFSDNLISTAIRKWMVSWVVPLMATQTRSEMRWRACLTGDGLRRSLSPKRSLKSGHTEAC